jgi:hypothetical protein
VIAFITEREVVESILESLGLPTTGPPIEPARSRGRLEPDGWQDDVPMMQRAFR